MPYTNGQRVIITAGTHAGRKATVLAAEQAGRVGVLVDGLSEGAFRTYAVAGVKADVATPSPTPPPATPPTEDPWASSPHQRLVLDEQWTNLDPAKWGRYVGPGHAKHGLRVDSAWTIEDGVGGANGRALVCTASWLDLDEARARLAATPMSDGDRSNVLMRINNNGGCTITGGMAHRFDAPTGRYECRIRSEPDPSAVTSPIFMTWPKDNSWWALRGEFDVYEPGSGNTDRNPGHAYFHYGADNRQIAVNVLVDCTQWHTVVFDRRRDALMLWYDGMLVANITDPALIAPESTGGWPHHVSLQLDATKDTKLSAPVKMYVDYVKVWQP